MMITKKKVRGSFTLEAAVIVPIVMIVLITVIFLGIYLHNMVTILTVSDIAALECAEKQQNSSAAGQNAESMLSQKLIGESGASISISAGKNITASASASVNFPLSMIRSLLGKSSGNVNASIRLDNMNGREVLLLYKNIIDGVNGIMNRSD